MMFPTIPPTMMPVIHSTVTLPAPAKLNVYLHITGKRSDGYHCLDTVFQLIDLQDSVSLRCRDDGVLQLHTPIAGLPHAQHLAMKAARLLKAATHGRLGADIWVEKRIPSGAGLGGGSSDAATTLMGLNQLWQCGLNSEQLQALGLELGADVPFFCSTFGAARALGIGEVLCALTPPVKQYLVVFPDCHVPTPAVFKQFQFKGDSRPVTQTDTNNWFGTGLQNDLQLAALSLAPAIGQAIECLQRAPNCEGVRMSGSGSAVFAQFADLTQAHAALLWWQAQYGAQLRHWGVWLTKGLTVHPAKVVLSECF